jgi:isopenicillin-N epimerase
MLPLNLRKLDCDFYTASCHKWLSAPFGSGFLYVAPRQQKRIQPAIISWGGSIGGRQPGWKDEFNWLGTRNPAAFLATADAIRFLQSTASPENSLQLENADPAKPHTMLDEFQRRSRQLTQLATNELCRTIAAGPLILDDSLCNDSMISILLPAEIFPAESSVGKAGHRHPLQDWLWQQHRIEIPIVAWGDQLLIRVSAHLYNAPEEYSRLAEGVRSFTIEM